MRSTSMLFVLFWFAVVSVAAADRPNVLFIAVDDLRPELKCYGASQINSPNIDRLAKRSMLFERAYCMVPTCGASRSSLMTSLRPAHNRFINFLTRADVDAPHVDGLHTHFKKNGYHTVSLGKVFHHRSDSSHGWSEEPWRAGAVVYHLPENRRIQREKVGSGTKPGRAAPYENAEVPDDAYPDGQLAEHAVGAIDRLAKRKRPFFLAVGFFKPHLPFNAPRKYWDLYPEDTIKLPDNYRQKPKDTPRGAAHNSGELRAYHGVPRRGPVSDEMARNLIRGYYACVSYTDALVGKLLDKLDRLKLADNTIVVLWGDHGWNLGEHTMWCKHSCFETSLQVPLLVVAPGYKAGRRSRRLVELIDIYPTLCDLAGLPKPDHLQGQSLVPLLKNPDAKWKPQAISRYNSGDTIRTDHFRYTQYSSGSKVLGQMLYNHETDPAENTNIAGQATEAKRATNLAKRLQVNMSKSSPRQKKKR
jgi:arylsulfatase A-like enzyme